jgi:hypothetical protein
MKIALLISGLLREYKKSFNSLKETFDIDGIDLDLYIHTWKTEKDIIDDKWGLGGGKQVNRSIYKNHEPQLKDPVAEYLTEINEIIPITDVQIESQIDNPGICAIRKRLGSKFKNKWSPHNLSCQLYSIYQCNELRKQSNKHYDLVIRARTELIFKKSMTHKFLKEILDNNCIAIPDGLNCGGGINDTLAIGTVSAMDWYCEEIYHYEPEINPHLMILRHIESKYRLARFNLPYTLREKRIDKIPKNQKILYSKPPLRLSI